jgi:propanol-preferring alcohol dehydrogenase
LKTPARGTIGVFGLGGVGIFAVRFAIAMGFEVLGFDISPIAREEAVKAGASSAFDSSDFASIKNEVEKRTDGRLLDGAIVAAGVIPAYDTAIKLTGTFK